MIVLNGKKFAESEKEFINSLHKSGGTCAGYYKPLKRQVKIMNPAKKLIAVVTCYGVLLKASKLEDGKYWYNFGDIPEIDTDRFKGDRPQKEREEVHAILEQFNIQRKF